MQNNCILSLKRVSLCKILHFNMDTEKFNAKALGNNIQVARGTLKLKREDLADIVDVSTRTMASIEGGSTDITVKRLFQIADALETSVPKLLNMEDGGISNSFNNIQEHASVQGIGNTRMEADREWMQEVSKRFAFFEDLVLSLRNEVDMLRQNQAT